MKKNLILCILVFSLITLMLPVNATSDNVVFNVSLPTELPRAGEAFEVSVDISNNPGFCAIQFVLSYDETIMKCDDVITDGILNGTLSATNPEYQDGAIVAAASLKVLEGNGSVALYAFTATKDITDYGFKLKDIVLVDENNDDIPYEVIEAFKDNETPVVPENPSNKDDTEDTIDTPAEDINIQQGNQEPSEPDTEAPTDIENNNGGKEENINSEKTPAVVTPGNEETSFEHGFSDIKGHWAESFIDKATKQGLFKGDENGKFNPDDHVTRAQFVTVLWRMAGSPEVADKVPFVDIDTQIAEFKSAISWGYANGYINGTSDTTFSPNGTLTREASMKILHYYAGGQIGLELQLYGVYDGLFHDSAKISPWAKGSIYWGIYNKIISGTSESSLSPQGTATRAQLAKILVNYLNIQ